MSDSRIRSVRSKLSSKLRFVCNECGHRFQHTIGPRTFDVKCPKCGGYDCEPESY